jgi:hypothetical protein
MALALKIALLWAALITAVLYAWHRLHQVDREWERLADDLGWGEPAEWADQ